MTLFALEIGYLDMPHAVAAKLLVLLGDMVQNDVLYVTVLDCKVKINNTLGHTMRRRTKEGDHRLSK